MAKKSSLQDDILNFPTQEVRPAAKPVVTDRSGSAEILARLDDIAMHVRHIDNRDRLRMIGSSIRNLIALSFLVFTIWSSIYLVTHMTEIIKAVTEQTAKATMNYGKTGSEDFMKQIQNMMKK